MGGRMTLEMLFHLSVMGSLLAVGMMLSARSPYHAHRARSWARLIDALAVVALIEAQVAALIYLLRVL